MVSTKALHYRQPRKKNKDGALSIFEPHKYVIGMRAAIGCREAILADAKNFEAFDAREETTIRAFFV